MIPAPKQPHASQVHLFLLGSFRLESVGVDEQGRSKSQIIDLPTRKIESLLAYLTLHPEPHTREKMAALIWGNSADEHARNSLRNALSALRKRLGDDLLVVDRETVQLSQLYPLWADAIDFKKQADALLTASNPSLEDVNLTLYRGELLTDYYDEWILPDREEYRELYLETLLKLTQTARAQSEYPRAIQYAQKILQSDAANERAYQHLMFSHLARGDRGAALQEYEACRRALETELAVEPMPETTALYQWIRETSPQGQPLEPKLTNLPFPVSSFIGRKRETSEVKGLLSSHRLLTLTGAGGSGKTRLAIQVATDLVDQYQDGVWWIELAPLMDESLVPNVIAKALGVREVNNQPMADSLVNWIGARQMLLILDNCEHLVAACAFIADKLLQTCPNLVILATSREGLAIAGEVTWLVPLLSLPETQDWLELFQDYEAIRLFTERAKAAKSDFELTEQNALVVAQICRRLDGIPLAIELAAARVRVLSVEEIAARLGDRFNLLTTGSRAALPRQQTLRALIAWSHDLLSPEEKILFRRLSVFHGGRTLEAVEQVCSGEGISTAHVLDLLGRLIDKSLLLTEKQNGATIYRILDTIRHYAQEELVKSGEAERTRDRHARYFLKLAEQAEPELQGPNQSNWLNRLETERNNLRTALDWTLREIPQIDRVGSDLATGLKLAGALYWFWVIRGPLSEGRRWLESALAASPSESRDAARAKALSGLGEIAWNQSDMLTARKAYGEALEIWRELKNPWWIAFGVLCNGYVELNEDHVPEALDLIGQSVSLAREIGDKSLLARGLRGLGNALMLTDMAKAHEALQESVTLCRQVGDKLRLAYTLDALGKIAEAEQDTPSAVALCTESVDLLRQVSDRVNSAGPIHSLGQALLAQGEAQKAKELFTEGLALAHQVNDRLLVALNLMGFAGVALARGRSKRATRLLAAGEALLSDIPPSVWQRYNVNYQRHLKAVRANLAASIFDEAWATGHNISQAEAIYLAMSDED